ncbi:MAG: triose-phosphate isomerase [bacterium]|nr:triose-phosphate isomerase [bacterium]
MRKLIVANWKMNPESEGQAGRLLRAVLGAAKKKRDIDLIFCLPFPWLTVFTNKEKERVSFGAQNVFWEDSGAFTGEVSPVMLKNSGVEYVIIGHSERRKYLAETDEMVAKKVAACFRNGLTPIICLGGGLSSGDGSAKIKQVLKSQLQGAFTHAKKIQKTILVYEPTWAISAFGGQAVRPKHAAEIAVYLKGIFSKIATPSRARATPVIYGGSADEKSGPEILRTREVDGLLVGAASLNSVKFKKLLSGIRNEQSINN